MNHSNTTNTDRDAYLQLGKSLNEQHSNQLSTQLQVFQSALIILLMIMVMKYP